MIDLFGILTPILDQLFVGVLAIDQTERIFYYNQFMSDLDELSREEVLGYRICEVYSVRDCDSPTQIALRTGTPVLNRYMLYKTARGKQLASINYAYPIFSKGKVVAAICMVVDITVFAKQAEVTLKNEVHQKPHSELLTKITFNQLLGKNPLFREALDVAKIAAKGPSPVLLIGETGTGKDLLAQAIHHYGNRAKERFVAINCSAIPEALLEGLLFGTSKGAFTGAIDKEGLLEHSSGGTLFLDEINSMPLALQAKLLRVLQAHKVRRVGSLSEKIVDLRLISATNINPIKAIAENTLRADLYYRLGVIQIQIPPLRERQEDIPLLVNFFIEKIGLRLGKKIDGISPEAMAILRANPWIGNVRELEHSIESVLNFVSDHETLTEKHFKRISRQQIFKTDFDTHNVRRFPSLNPQIDRKTTSPIDFGVLHSPDSKGKNLKDDIDDEEKKTVGFCFK
jgi:arginine utilization regulatory protein